MLSIPVKRSRARAREEELGVAAESRKRAEYGCGEYGSYPKGPKIENFQDLEIFKRD